MWSPKLVAAGLVVLWAGAADAQQAPVFSQDRDNYFVTGVSGDTSTPRGWVRFQYSIKFDVVPNGGPFTAFLGYTQRSLWNVWDGKGSSPFEDSAYNPSLMLAWRPAGFSVMPSPHPGPQILFARLIAEHESNGRDGAASRSWNRLSASVRAGHYVGHGGTSTAPPTGFHHLIAEAKVWLPSVAKRDDAGGGNPDLLRSFGYGQYSVEYGHETEDSRRAGTYRTDLVVGVLGRVGSRGDRGYVETWVRFRPVCFEGFALALYAQLVAGYGETLLRYEMREPPTFRIGIALDDRASLNTAQPLY